MNIRYQYNYVTSLLKRYGVKGLVLKTLERSQSPMRTYTACYKQYMPTEEELDEQRKTPLSYQPLVSIVMPAYETAEIFLRELLDSVLAQTYTNWELCIADGSKSEAVERVVLEYQKRENRIQYKHLVQNGGISENTNAAFEMANGEYIALLDHDDLITANALYEMVSCLNQYEESDRRLAFVYSDEDKINSDGSVHSRPHFKPDFNREFLMHNNYICHFLMFSRELLQRTKGLRMDFDGAQDYDFVLRCVEAGAVVSHVPKILYHWRIHQGSTAGNSADKEYAFDNGCKAIEQHLKRSGVEALVRVTPNLGVYQVTYELPKKMYSVSVLCNSEKRLEHYRKVLGERFISQNTEIVLDYLCIDALGKSALSKTKGEYLLVLDEGIISFSKENMIDFCRMLSQRETGIVGAKILDAHGKIVSNGYIYDAAGNLIPSQRGLNGAYKGYFLHAVIPQNVSAVSMDCAMIKREVWELLEEDRRFSNDYYGADLSFLMSEHGYETVVTPEVTVKNRSTGKTLSREEQEIFYNKWKQKLQKPDGCYNSNLSLQNQRTYEMND